VLSGAAYLLGAVLQWRSCWLAGGLSAALFLVLFWRSNLPYQSLLQVYYLLVAVHGWIHWGAGDGAARPGPGQAEVDPMREAAPATAALPVQRWPLRWHLAAIAGVLLLALLSLALRAGPATPLAALDALTAWGSVLATWLVARKVLENWLYWIVIDAAAVYLYWHSGLAGTAALFAIYTVIAVFGWIRWRGDSPAPAGA
jgi:nicotinamide mononucleotide transporter